MDDQPTPLSSLGQLRAQIDAIDDQIHDLLMRRALVVEEVAHDAGKGGTKIRPGREARILRRLLGRHAGSLPAQAITRFWREMFAAALIIEGGQTIAVSDGEGGADRLALAREHFGPLTPMRRHHNPAQTLADVARESAQVAVLPEPGEDDESEGGWWTALTATGARRLHVIAKIPFWTRRAEGSPQGSALVVAGIRPDASGADKTLVVLELKGDTSRTRVITLLKDAGFTPGQIWMRRVPGDLAVHALVELDGFLEEDDPRLGAISGQGGRPVVIGSFAVPLGEGV
ncbi:MAG: chorismate mutase [Acidocella sp.]|nr:chorismate mutase [Acidocella sp.]